MPQNIEFNWKFNNSDLDAALSKWKDLNKEIHSAAKDFEKLNKAAKNMKAPDPAKWKEVSTHIKNATQALMKFNQAAARMKAPSLKGWKALTKAINDAAKAVDHYNGKVRSARGPSSSGWSRVSGEIRRARQEAERYNRESSRGSAPGSGGSGRGGGGRGGGHNTTRPGGGSGWSGRDFYSRQGPPGGGTGGGGSWMDRAQRFMGGGGGGGSGTSMMQRFGDLFGGGGGGGGGAAGAARGAAGAGRMAGTIGRVVGMLGRAVGMAGRLSAAFGPVGIAIAAVGQAIGKVVEWALPKLLELSGAWMQMGMQVGAVALQIGQTLGEWAKKGVEEVFKATATHQKYISQMAVMFARDTKETAGKDMSKSYAMAESAMKRIQQIAAKTPLSVGQITEAYISLSRRGLRPTEEQLVALGDLATAGGKKMTQLAEAILDAQQGEKERLKEFGIEMKESGGKITLSVGKIKVEGKQILETFTKLAQQKGIAGAMLESAKTAGGLLSTFKDQWEQLLVVIGTTPAVFSGIKVPLIFITSLMEAATNKFGDVADTINKKMRPAINAAIGAFKPIIELFTSIDYSTGLMTLNVGDNVDWLSHRFLDTAKVVEYFEEVFKKFAAIMGEVADRIQPDLQNLWKAFDGLFASMGLAEKAGHDTAAYGQTVDTVSGVLKFFIDALTEVVKKLSEMMKPMKNGRSEMQEWWAVIKGILASYGEQARSTSKITTELATAFKNLFEFKLISSMKHFSIAFWEYIAGPFKQFFEAMGVYNKTIADMENKAREIDQPFAPAFGKDMEGDAKDRLKKKGWIISGELPPGTDMGVSDKDKPKKEAKPEDPFDLEMANLKRWHQKRLFEIDESMGEEKKTQEENAKEILDQEASFLDKTWELKKKFGKLTNASNVEMETEGDKLHQDFQRKVWDREYATINARNEIRMEEEMHAAKERAIAKRTSAEELDRELKIIQQEANREQTILMKTYGKLSEAEELQRIRAMEKMSDDFLDRMRQAEIDHEVMKVEAAILHGQYAVEKFGHQSQQSAEFVAFRLLEVEVNQMHRLHRLRERAGVLTLAQQEEFGLKLLANKQNQYRKLYEMAQKAVITQREVEREMLERSAAGFGIMLLPAFGEMKTGQDDFKEKIIAAKKQISQMNQELQKMRENLKDPNIDANSLKMQNAIQAANKNLEGLETEAQLKKIGKVLEGISQAGKVAADVIKDVFASQINAKDKQLAALDAEADKLGKIVDQEEKRAEVLKQQQGIINAMAEQRIKELEHLTTTVPEAEKARVDQDIEFEKQRIRAIENAKNNAASAEKARLKGIEKDKERVEKQKQRIMAKQFEAERMANIFSTIMNTAMGIVNAFAMNPLPSPIGPISAKILGAVSAAQIAQIASQPNPYKQYREGTLFVDMPGAVRDRDSVPAMLTPGEAVIPALQNKKYGPTLAAIYNSQIPPELINSFVKDFKVGSIDPRIFGAHGGNVFVNAGVDADKIVKAINEKETMSVNIDNEGFHAYIESHNEQTKIRDKKLHTSR